MLKRNSDIAIGERIKSARMQLGFSRKAFEEKFGIPAATIQAWEDVKYPVPLKGVSRFVEALSKAGLIASKEWFVSGLGSPPRPALLPSNSNSNPPEDELTEDEIILREITYFESINKTPIITMLSDDTMKPIFELGDYVGGNIISGEFASQYIDTICIVILNSGETFVRKLKKGTAKGLYNLFSENVNTNEENAFITNCKIHELAQVVWHRKTEKVHSI